MQTVHLATMALELETKVNLNCSGFIKSLTTVNLKWHACLTEQL